MIQSWFTQRIFTMAAGGLCLAAAVAVGWSLWATGSPADADPFADLDAELNASTVSLGEPAASPVLPALSPVEIPAAPFDSDPLPLLPGFEPSESGPAMTANFTTSDGTGGNASVANPVWLLGTIEPLDDETAPSVVPLNVRQAVGPERFQR